MKTILMLLGFGCFLFTGNWWAAAGVILLGLIQDAKPASKMATPVKEGWLSCWMSDQVKQRNEASYERDLRAIRGTASTRYVGPQELSAYRNRNWRFW
jgi:hypothetical protein